MKNALYPFMLLLAICVQPACMRATSSVALNVSERPVGPRPQPTITPAKTFPWIIIATGRIDIERVFSQQLGAGTDDQNDSGRVDFEVRQRKDWFDSGQVDGGEITGQGSLVWTEAVRTSNCSWNANATGTIQVTGMLYGPPQCKLTVQIKEQWNAPSITWSQCAYPLGQLPAHPNVSYYADFPLQNNTRLRGVEVVSGMWNEKWWWLRDLTLDARILCFPERSTPSP